MTFLADECFDAQLVQRLRSLGYDVFYVAESMSGAIDDDILGQAYRENRILLTEDKDFGELIYRLRRPAHGIVLLRFAPGEETLKAHRLSELLLNHASLLLGSFIVLEVNKLRIRPLT